MYSIEGFFSADVMLNNSLFAAGIIFNSKIVCPMRRQHACLHMPM
jgi:hypothetical protein